MKKSIFIKILLFFAFVIINSSVAFSAKYTIVNGKEFNNRIKLSIDSNLNSASPEYTIIGFKNSPFLKGNAIDISEDGDSSVLAYIDNNIIYFVSDEDVYLNEDASFMFDKFVNLKEVDLTYLNFSKTRKMNFMFSNCKYLSKLDMDNDTTITLNEMEGMFFNCQSLVDLYIFMLNTRNVKNMNSLFYNCKNLKNIYINPKIWSISNVNNFNKMFYNCLMLKTNFNLKATDINESKYKIYAVAGEEYREALLRDYDFEYDEIVYTNETAKVDNIKDNIIDASENKNNLDNVKQKDIENSKKFLNVHVSSVSQFYEHASDYRISLNDRTDNSGTLPDVPILKEETTFVDRLVPKNKSTNSVTNIIPESNIENETNGIIRPNYDNVKIEETSIIKVDNEILEPESQNKGFFEENFQNILIFFGIILIIVIGFVVANKKNQEDSKDL